MYIQPNSNIYLLSDVPLDNSYTHSLYWTSSDGQRVYFMSKSIAGWNDYSFIRESDGVARVGKNAAELYSVNYMMFQNQSYSSKWFYAFVTKVEYINDSVSRVYFEIDSIQTWFFEMNLGQCFIERQHARTDGIGDNLIPDNLDIGEYKIYRQFNCPFLGPTTIDASGKLPDGWCIALMSPYNGSGTLANGTADGNIYSGLNITYSYTLTEANNLISSLTEKNLQDSIVCVYMAPTNFIPSVSGFDVKTYFWSFDRNQVYDNIDGYQPKNKKLFTYPYNFMGMSDNQGNMAEYRYEYFSNNDIVFDISGSTLPDAQFSCVPNNYKGSGKNYNEMMVLTGLPSCSYATDYYKAWLAQNNSSITLNRLKSGANMIGGMLFGSPVAMVGGIVSSVSEVANEIQQRVQASAMPDHVHGSQSASIMYSKSQFTFTLYNFTITREFAQIIDDYWTMYGYPIHRVQRPNLAVRQNYTFVKTKGCAVGGMLPNDDRLVIENCFNRGITFWKNANNVGNYSVSNLPAG